jgi:hypothetical protein
VALSGLHEGEVVFLENHEGNTNVDPKVPGFGTAILIRHADGTVAAYDHLKYMSPVVSKDQQFSRVRLLQIRETPDTPILPTCTLT